MTSRDTPGVYPIPVNSPNPKSAIRNPKSQIRNPKSKMSILDHLKYDSNGLIPAIIQDDENGQVLMMAWMNRESLQRTVDTGKCTYWSRSRQSFWVKGETSGHVQHVKKISVDCDLDALLIRV